MKITIENVYMILRGKAAYDEQKEKDFQVSLLLVHNVKVAKAEAEKFEQAQNELIDSDEYKEFQERRKELIDSYRKIEDGSYVTTEVNGNPVFEYENTVEMECAVKKLESKYSELMNKIKAHNDGNADRIKTEIEAPFKKFTRVEQVEKLSKDALVAFAPLIDVKMTNAIMQKHENELTVDDIEKILEYCKFEE